MRTTDDFNKAPVGTAAIGICAACGAETGDVLLKRRGTSPDKVRYTGPRGVAVEGQYCEFCEFVGIYKQAKQEGHEGKIAAGKIVVGEERKLVAYVPFLEDEDVKEITVGDEQVPRAHGLVIRAEENEDGKGMTLVEVLERGIPCDDLPKEKTDDAG